MISVIKQLELEIWVENAWVVGVDGSYLYWKQEKSDTVDTSSTMPEPPIIGWEATEDPTVEIVKQIPIVTHGMLMELTCTFHNIIITMFLGLLYTYLSCRLLRSKGKRSGI